MYLVQHQYSLKDITRVFMNMNLMKKFEIPEEFDNTSFIQEAMTKSAKISLEHFKERKPFIETRERSYTYHAVSNNKFNNTTVSFGGNRKSNEIKNDEYHKLRDNGSRHESLKI